MSDKVQEQVIDTCASCDGMIDVTGVRPFEKVECPHCQATVHTRASFNHFTILEEIGEGGMSRVFRAIDNNLGREVALKILHMEFGDHPELMSQFEREARITASINHPNVVEVYSVGRDQGLFYIAMELLETASLDKQIEQSRLTEVVALRMLHEVTRGLAAAHASGLIHRDIKPGNILSDEHGTSKLVDFGLALVQGNDEELSDLWATPWYVPPEKLEGKTEDFRSDIYSLGATAFHALAGKPAFDANTNSVEELIEIKKQPVNLKAEVPRLSDRTIGLVNRMMAYRPEDRHASYDALLDEVITVRKELDPEMRSGSGRLPLWAKIAIPAGSLLVIAALAAILFSGDDSPRAPRGAGGEDNPRMVSLDGGGDVAVSLDDTAMQRLLREGRQLLVDGKLTEAGLAFAEVTEVEKNPSETRSWALYLGGLVYLMKGDEVAARARFATLASEAKGHPDVEPTEFASFADLLSRKEIVKPEAMKEEPLALFPFGFLAVGLKNWHLGDWKSGAAFLSAYEEESFEGKNEWMGAFQDVTNPKLAEVRLLQGLTAPEMNWGEEQLQSAMQDYASVQMQLAEASPVRSRIDEWTALCRKQLDVLVRMQQEILRKADHGVLVTAVEQEEGLGANFQFAEGAALWSDLKLDTEEARNYATYRKEAWERAGTFFTTFLEKMSDGNWEGEILRKEGSPFTARVVGCNRKDFIVDLGFGDTVLKLESIAPGGLLKMSAEHVLPESEPPVKEGAAIFAWLQGEPDQAEMLATQASQIPGFTQRWEAIVQPPVMETPPAGGDAGVFQ